MTLFKCFLVYFLHTFFLNDKKGPLPTQEVYSVFVC